MHWPTSQAGQRWQGDPKRASDSRSARSPWLEQCGLARPARALGYRGAARATAGDAGGLADYRDALDLAIQAGQGRAAAILYNNLGVDLRNYEGPRAALEVFGEGLRFASARGLQEMALSIRSSALVATLCVGDLLATLAAAAELAVHAEDSGDELDLVEIRTIQALALTYEGHADAARDGLAAVVDGARQLGRSDLTAQGLGGAAVVYTALDERQAAVALLSEVEATDHLADASELATYLPAIVRSAIELGALDLGERLAGHLTPRYPCAEHALVAVHAALSAARGQREAAVDGYREAASRWNAFGMVIEEGFALLGQGRCLLELSSPGDANAPLLAARDIFTRCGMDPALMETDELLARATRHTS